MKVNFDAVRMLLLEQDVADAEEDENEIQVTKLEDRIHIQKLHQKEITDHACNREQCCFTNVQEGD